MDPRVEPYRTFIQLARSQLMGIYKAFEEGDYFMLDISIDAIRKTLDAVEKEARRRNEEKLVFLKSGGPSLRTRLYYRYRLRRREEFTPPR